LASHLTAFCNITTHSRILYLRRETIKQNKNTEIEQEKPQKLPKWNFKIFWHGRVDDNWFS
jgi:hypothetical protein